MIILVNGLQQRFFLSTPEGDPAARWIQNRMLIPHVGWPYALALAKTCIEECVRDHPECQAITPYPIGSAPLPTRLIDCSNPDRLRLVATDPGMRGVYIALSYVWGEDQPHQTTKANLSSYKDRIDPAILPQTLRDAIHVTRALGIDFLWIDGLCIVQDSEKDMHHELARMRDVYRHAVLTIDASSAARVSEGFLQDRKLDPMPDAVLPFICSSGNPAEQSADEARVGVIYLAGDRSLYYTLHDSRVVYYGKPLSHTVSRGWCLQERLLSTRSLVFTSQTLQLRCHTQTKNVGGAHHDGDYDVPRLPDAVFHPDRLVAPGSDEWKHIHERWWEIVEDYTRRKLTNPSDKLIAISGLAEMFAPTLGQDYLAGLWRNTLLTDLSWSCDSPQSLSLTEYRGPSWSWAYIDNSVSLEDDWGTGVPFAEMMGCTVTLQNETLHFGPVTGASLILRSSLLPCKWVNEQLYPEEYDLVPEFPSFSSPFSLDQSLYFRRDVDITDLLETRMWFVPVVHYCDPDELCMRGLVGDVYRRVGLADFEISVIAKQDSMDTFEDSDVDSMLSRLPRVDIELV
ncbi:HET-domain-containing protein [Cubamyces sp. BRFM 1775]|nr:HET-domain-containing protein [Cubamyces sp. BRFM 1775]